MRPRGLDGMAAPAARIVSTRFAGWCHVNAVVCPVGHAIPRDTFILTDGVVRCKHRLGTAGSECGKLLYLLASVPVRSPDDTTALVFVVEVTYLETQLIERQRWGTLDILRHLGATPVERRRAPAREA